MKSEKKKINKLWLIILIVIFVILFGLSIFYIILKKKTTTNTEPVKQLSETDIKLRDAFHDINSCYGKKFYTYIKGDSVNTAWLGTKLDQFMTGTPYDVKELGLSICGYVNPNFMFFNICYGRYGGTDTESNGKVNNMRNIPDDSLLFNGYTYEPGSDYGYPGVLIWIDEQGTYVCAASLCVPYESIYTDPILAHDNEVFSSDVVALTDKWRSMFNNSMVRIGEGMKGELITADFFQSILNSISNGSVTGRTSDGILAFSGQTELLHDKTNIPLFSDMINSLSSELSFSIQETDTGYYINGICGTADFWTTIEPDSIFHQGLDYANKTIYNSVDELIKAYSDIYGFNPITCWNK